MEFSGEKRNGNYALSSSSLHLGRGAVGKPETNKTIWRCGSSTGSSRKIMDPVTERLSILPLRDSDGVPDVSETRR